MMATDSIRVALMATALTLVTTAVATAQGPRVLVCHISGGDTAAAHEITIAGNALPAHLAHGDLEGPCPPPKPENIDIDPHFEPPVANLWGGRISLRGRLGRVDPADVAGSVLAIAAELAEDEVPEIIPQAPPRFVITRNRTGPAGRVHLRLRQQLDGEPIVRAHLQVHVNAAHTRVYAVEGLLANTNGTPREPYLDALDAFEEAWAVAMITSNDPPELLGEPELAFVADQHGQTRLAWTARLRYAIGDEEAVDRWYVDATTAELVHVRPGRHALKSWATYDANHGSTLPGTLVVSNGGATSDAMLMALHDNVSSFYDYFYQVHGRDSYDDAGATIIASGHFMSNYTNAFWNGSQLVCGDGNGTDAGPLGNALDVVAHELTHAINDHTADLVFSDQSGAVLESLADIMGACVEAWRDGGVNADSWKVGEDTWTPWSHGDALRYMNDPTRDGYSVDYYPNLLYGLSCTATLMNDYCGVHGNGGIGNLAFYLLVVGGTHPRGLSVGYVPGIGITKAGAIFYRALDVYLTSQADYEMVRLATAQAAADLYGPQSPEQAAVHAAWEAVGVPGPAFTSAPTALQNGEPLIGVTGTAGSDTTFVLSVPSGATGLSVSISGGSGDADLYVKRGSAPTITSYDCRPYKSGSSESCSFPTPLDGSWYVMLHAYASYSGVSLTASWTGSAGSNIAPTAFFDAAVSGYDLSLTDTSADPDGAVASWLWDLGDGATSGVPDPQHTYAAPAVYTVSLTVTDDDGESATSVQQVRIGLANLPPTAGFSYTVSGLTVSFADASTDVDGTIAARRWRFGDGLTGRGRTPVHTYAAPGTYDVVLRVRDDDGDTDRQVATVTVTDPALGNCTAGQVRYAGTLGGTGQQAVEPPGGYYFAAVAGTHAGLLAGASNADFDLYLARWDGQAWVTVATSQSSSSIETISHHGQSGFYNWRVHSYSGSGAYELCLDLP